MFGELKLNFFSIRIHVCASRLRGGVFLLFLLGGYPPLYETNHVVIRSFMHGWHELYELYTIGEN